MDIIDKKTKTDFTLTIIKQQTNTHGKIDFIYRI